MVDLINNGAGQGAVAQRVLGAGGNLNVNTFRPWLGSDGNAYITVFKGGDAKDPKNYASQKIQTNATLRRGEWEELDQAVLRISDERLTGIQDLIGAGLVYNLGNGMGSTVLETHKSGDAMEAQASMDGINRSKGDRQTYSTEYLPLPIIHSDFEINARVLQSSRSLGNPLDTSNAERASRKVSEKLEEMLFTDTSYSFGGGSIYSYLNHPHKNTVSLGTHWDASAATGESIVKDVTNMKQESISANKFGPWVLYVPKNYETVLDGDYDTTRGNTIRERIEAINGINSVKVADKLPDDTVVLVQMTSDTVRLVRGMGIQTVEWQTEGGMMHKYKVMTIQVPQIRADEKNQSGIVVLS
jgi:uncharacterized linocin/CFP29 family protein